MHGDQRPVERVVVRPPNWLGDAVLALPALAALRHHFAGASITIAAGGAVAALFHEDTGVRPDAVVVLPKGECEVVRTLRQIRADVGLLFPNSFRSAWQLYRAGVPERWGYAYATRGWMLTRKVAPTRHDGPQHHAEFYRALVRGLGVACDETRPRITPSLHTQRVAERQLGVGPLETARLVTLAPGAAYGQAKQWPPARAAALAARLIREHDVTCVLVGASHDRQAGRTIEAWLRAHAPEVVPRVRNLIGHTDLGTLVAITSHSRACVTNDSGVMHVAAATGSPVVAIFGPTDERVTRPLGRADVLTADVFCRPCHLRDCPIDHRCMKRITVDTVFEAVTRHLTALSSEASSL